MKTVRQRAEGDNMDQYLFSVFVMTRLIEFPTKQVGRADTSC